MVLLTTDSTNNFVSAEKGVPSVELRRNFLGLHPSAVPVFDGPPHIALLLLASMALKGHHTEEAAHLCE